MDTTRQLLEASREIGGLSGMAHWAFAGMVARVESTGKPLRDLTVGELLDLVARHDASHRETFITRKEAP